MQFNLIYLAVSQAFINTFLISSITNSKINNIVNNGVSKLASKTNPNNLSDLYESFQKYLV